jgi:branched-chain amino acid transport system permease protein
MLGRAVVFASAASDFTSYMAAGLSKGAIVALAALGFLLTFKATGVFNFAQGSLISLGAYLAIWGSQHLGLPILIAYLMAIAMLFVIGVAIERVAYAPLRGRSVEVVVIATFGASIIINTIINLWFGANPQGLDTPFDGNFRLFGASIPWQRLVIIVATLIVVVTMIFVFDRTAVGRQVRAVAADREIAQMHGVRVAIVSMMAFGLSAALAGLAGVLIGPLGAVDVNLGFIVMLGGFSAAILGGFGSLQGVVVGGFIIGFVEQVVGAYWFRDYQSILPFILMLLVIAVKPTGLFTKGGAHGRL